MEIWLLPKKLGEVQKKTYFSQKSWEKYVKKILVHFLSLGKKRLLPTCYDISQLFPDISQKSWEKSKNKHTSPKKIGRSMLKNF